jgi:hypothetical protein
VEELLVAVVADGFTLYCCGPKTAPNALVAFYEWDGCVDLLTIRDFDRVTMARVPTTRDAVDIFAPQGRGLGLRRSAATGTAGLARFGAPVASRRPYRRLPGASEPACSPRSATPDDDPIPVTGPHRGAGGPACDRDDDSRW